MKQLHVIFSLLLFLALSIGQMRGDETFELYSGAITEGDYIICYQNKAMNNVLSSKRLGFTEVTPSEGVIANPDASIIWHIAANSSKWTLYNESIGGYASSTGNANEMQYLVNTNYAMALWSISGEETYEFVNYQNTTNKVNANLRKNLNYGFSCYSTSTGGALTLYKKVSVVTIREGLSEGKWGTICPKQEVQQPEGALFYTLNHMDYTDDGAPYKFYFDELSAGTSLEAGKPYLFVADGTEIKGIKSGTPVADGEYAYNGFVGYIGSGESLASDNNTYTEGGNNYYGLYNNRFTLISSGNISNERAYIEISPTRQPASTQQPEPAHCSGRRLTVSADAPEMTTATENIDAATAPRKVVMDGTMYILRNGQRYDITGRLAR